MRNILKAYSMWLIFVPVAWLLGILFFVLLPQFGNGSNESALGAAIVLSIFSIVVIPFIGLCLTALLFIGMSFRSSFQKVNLFFKIFFFLISWLILTLLLIQITFMAFSVNMNVLEEFYKLFFGYGGLFYKEK